MGPHLPLTTAIAYPRRGPRPLLWPRRFHSLMSAMATDDLYGYCLRRFTWGSRTKFYFQPTFVSYATLRIHSELRGWAFEVDENGQASQFEVYKRTQKVISAWRRNLVGGFAGSKKTTEWSFLKLNSSLILQYPVVWVASDCELNFLGTQRSCQIRLEGVFSVFSKDAVNACARRVHRKRHRRRQATSQRPLGRTSEGPRGTSYPKKSPCQLRRKAGKPHSEYWKLRFRKP